MTSIADAGGTITQERLELLTELAVAVQKNAIYPSTHPLIIAAVGRLAERLAAQLEHTPLLAIGIAKQQLIIEGVATDQDKPILRELAHRLHRHQIGAMRFSRGLQRDELAEFLGTIAIEVGRTDKPLGLAGPEVLHRWPHARLFPLTFDQLELIDHEGTGGPGFEESDEDREARTEAAQLWIGLARAALLRDAVATLPTTDPDAVARALDETSGDRVYDQVVVGYMLQIADELRNDRGRSTEALRKRVSRLVRGMKPSTLQRLLTMGGDALQRAEFLHNASNVLSPEAVLDVVTAASEVAGQTISHGFTRLLTKLAMHTRSADEAAGQRADRALREQVQRLISSWELEDPNPEAYSTALESISRNRLTTAERPTPGLIEPERILQISLEVGVTGAQTRQAFTELRSRTDALPLLDLLDAGPPGETREILLSRLLTPAFLRELAEREPIPLRAIERVAPRVGAGGADVLIDALEAAPDRHGGSIVDLLVAMGETAATAIHARLESIQPGALRHLLHAIDLLGAQVGEFNPARYASHRDVGVRREAIKMMLRRDDLREQALLAAFADADERIVGVALGSALRTCPASAAPVLVRRVEDERLSADLRARAIRALAVTGSVEGMRWIARYAVRRHWLFKTPRLREKSPQVLSSITALASHWSSAPEAIEVLALVARSTDAEIRAAANIPTSL
jgi:hypothetical protein